MDNSAGSGIEFCLTDGVYVFITQYVIFELRVLLLLGVVQVIIFDFREILSMGAG